MRKMHDSIMELVQDPYGNYAVTEAIQVRKFNNMLITIRNGTYH